jgi:chromate reductase
MVQQAGARIPEGQLHEDDGRLIGDLTMIRLLAISGSLRQVSTNTALLQAMAGSTPPNVSIIRYDGMGDLPIFNPDREGELTPEPVLQLARQVRAADGLIISCPEYAHGIPGGLKNALDWLVSRDEIPNKPVMLVRASNRSTYALEALQEVLRTMSVRLMPEIGLTVHLLGKKTDEVERLLGSAELLDEARRTIGRFAGWIKETS